MNQFTNYYYYELRRNLMFEVFDKFPNASIRTKASIIFRDYPEMFRDYEHARAAVRYYHGRSGDKLRNQLTNQKYVKPLSTT